MKNFLKFLCVFVLVILVSAVSVSAEGGINANEQAILEKVQGVYSAGGKRYSVPVEYFNQARNFFLTVDVSKAQSDEIIGYIDEGIEILDGQVPKFSPSVVGLESFDAAAKVKIAELAKKAGAVLDLKIVYSDEYVTITDSSGRTVFSGAAIIKITGVKNKHLVFGAVSFTLIAATYVTCIFAFRKAKVNNE